VSTASRSIVVAAFVFLAFAAPAAARTVHCGEVITTDTRVSNDLQCPTPVAVEIGADGVDLDLRGHTIEAIQFEDENGSPFDYGIALLIPGYDDVSVENGTLIGHQSLGYGVLATEADGLSLRRVSTSGYASLIVSGAGVRLYRVTAIDGFASQVVSDGARLDRLTMNTELDVSGRDVRVRDGHFGHAGFDVYDSSLRRNVVDETLYVQGDGSSVERNRAFTMNLSGDDNSVLANRIEHGLRVVGGASRNRISDNVVTDNLGIHELDAVFVAEGTADNVLIRNSVSGGDDDGIDVEEPSTRLTKNVAFDNADLGIEAVAGVTDGGGNRAFGNGNPLQCLNVDCDA
jgi:hypothetical protein